MSEQTRMLLVESDRAVCVGGKWDGWLFWLHPNGYWVSARKLPETEPTIDPLFSNGPAFSQADSKIPRGALAATPDEIAASDTIIGSVTRHDRGGIE